MTLIDQNGYHQFQPLLYQVATAELAGADMTFDHHEIFHGQESVTLVKAEAVSADMDQRERDTADGTTSRATTSCWPPGLRPTSSTRPVLGVRVPALQPHRGPSGPATGTAADRRCRRQARADR